MTPRRAVCVLATAFALAGCRDAGSAHVLTTAPSAWATLAVASTGPVHSRAAAQAQADALLASVHLPPGAVSASAAPSSWLAEPGDRPAITTMVESKHWFTIPVSISQVATSIRSHAPRILDCAPAGMGVYLRAGATQVSGMTCTVTDAPSTREVQISALPEGTHTDVLVDVQVVWVPPRTRYDTVPASLTSARLTFTTAVEGVMAAPVTVTGTDLRRLAAAVNADPVAPPQSMPDSCPPGQGEATLAVSPHVTFQIDVYGCRDVTVLVDGKPETRLDYDETPGALAHALLKLPPYSWP